jgi:hypothetical protein
MGNNKIHINLVYFCGLEEKGDCIHYNFQICLWVHSLRHGGAVATLALGLWPRQGVGRWQAKKETRESLHMLPGVQRVWGNEPSHSQVNSHVGSWSPKKTPEYLERNFRGQNPLPQRVHYIIEKLLKRKCLKWARINHLDIWNTSYGQKKGRELNWQFDSRPPKVKNWPDFLTCMQCATYCWKALNKGYNPALDCIVIGGFHAKLCTSKVAEAPVVGILGLPLGSPRTKSHLDLAPMESCRVYYKGEDGGFPKFGPWWVLCVQVAHGSS